MAEARGRIGELMKTVRFLDVDTHQVITMPVADLPAGAIRARVGGIEGEVWVVASKLKSRGILHPPFDEVTQNYIRQIQAAFSEQHPLSFDEWESGFRRDATPSTEIAVWWYAAELFSKYAVG